MAQRFGGKFSPSAQTPPSGAADGKLPPLPRQLAEVNPVGLRANMMFVPAGLLLITSIWAGAVAMTLGLIGAGLWSGSALLLREGLKAEAAYNARNAARKPALPRKIAAALLCGLGAGFGATSEGTGLLPAGLYAIAAAGLHLAAFGIDPLRDKGFEGIDAFQSARVARVVDEAETHLTAMKDAALRAKDRQIELRVDQFQSVARALFRTVEEDPRDLTSARKYLTVYLLGARDATVKFADIFARSRDAQARVDYLALLDDLEQNFAARNQRLLLEDRSDLTIEIDVLRARLEREGVHMDRTS